MKIEIISREVIKPSSPTPSHLKTLSLSLIDQPIPHTFIPVILYYSQITSTNHTQSQISKLLKTSLSNTLNLYYPLAGQMKGEAFVDCNDKGVDYLETRVHCPLADITQLPCAEVLSQLCPSDVIKGATDVQLSIQCNFFSCGGIAMAMLISHRIGDCCTLASFLKTWAKMAQGDGNITNPSFISSSIFPPRDPFGFTVSGSIPEKEILTKKFYFSGSKIAALREKVLTSSPTLTNSTRVQLVIALIWKCFMNANRGKGYTSSVATQPVNIRSRMHPPLPENSFGNIFRTISVPGNSEMDLAAIAMKLKEGVLGIDKEIERFRKDGYKVISENRKRVMEMSSSNEVLWVKFASWCRFPFYEVDFGFGEPFWISCSKRGVKNDCILLDSKFGGGIEAWISMEEDDMMAFEQDPELLAFQDLFD